MLQIAICDDEPVLLEEIEKITAQCLKEQNIFPVISTFSSGEHLLYEIADGAFYDLLLLDIEMPGISGMKLAGQIHEKLKSALIIFVTAHYKYAIDAYELNIFRYVPKNQISIRLPHAILDAAAVLEIQNAQSYLISSTSRMERIPLKDVLYLMREGKNAVFHMKNGMEPVKLRKSLSEIYKELDSEDFIFIDRGCIVNLRHIASIQHTDCILTDGARLFVAQSRLSELKRKLNEFWSNRV